MADTQQVRANASESFAVAMEKVTAYVVETTEDLAPDDTVDDALMTEGRTTGSS